MAKKDKKQQLPAADPVEDVSEDTFGNLERLVDELNLLCDDSSEFRAVIEELQNVLETVKAEAAELVESVQKLEVANSQLAENNADLESRLKERSQQCEVMAEELQGRRNKQKKETEFVVPESLKTVSDHGLEAIESAEAIAHAIGMPLDDVVIRLEAAASKKPDVRRNLGTEDEPVIGWQVYSRVVWMFLGVEFVPRK